MLDDIFRFFYARTRYLRRRHYVTVSNASFDTRKNLDIVFNMLLGSLVTLASFTSTALAKILYAGINEVRWSCTCYLIGLVALTTGIYSQSGGEFGVFGAKGTGLPGRFNQDFAFINKVL